MAKKWSEEEVTFLSKNFQQLSNKELAEKLGVTAVSVKAKLKKLGLTRNAILKNKVIKGKKKQVTSSKARKKLETDKYNKALNLYQQGMKNLHNRYYLKAIDKFQSLIEIYEEINHLVDKAKMYIKICNARLNKTKIKLNNVEDYYLWGVYNCNNGKLKEALDSFQKALKMSPKDNKILYLLASTHALMGNKSESLNNLKDAIKLNKDNRVYALKDSDFQLLMEDEEFISLTTLEPEQIKKVKV